MTSQSQNILSQFPPADVQVVMFHDVFDPINDHSFPKRQRMRSFMTTIELEFFLDWASSRFDLVTLNDLDKPFSRPRMVLSFDDGMRDAYINVLPILERRGIKAHFFIPTQVITDRCMIDCHRIQYILAGEKTEKEIVDEIMKFLNWTPEERIVEWTHWSTSLYPNNLWTPEMIFTTRLLRSLQRNHPIFNHLFSFALNINNPSDLADKIYMTSEMVLDIIKKGHAIGGHGHMSFDLRSCDADSTTIELVECKMQIDSWHCQAGKSEYNYWFCYPNGGITPLTKKILLNQGCKGALTTQRRRHTTLDDQFEIPRLEGTIDYPMSILDRRIVLCGVQNQGVEIYHHLKRNGIRVSHVVTIDQKEAERQKASGWVDYKEKFQGDNVEIHHLKHYGCKHPDDLAYFQYMGFDLMILGGWQRLIPENILKTLRFGGLGQHGSPEMLPMGRGRSPLNWSIVLGYRRLIWNIFHMAPGVDDGDIVDSRTFEINEWDTCFTVYLKVEIAVRDMYVDNIPKIFSGTLNTIKQRGEPTYFLKRSPEDGKIDWNSSMYTIHNLVRGVTKPYPGAFTMLGERKIMIWSGQPFTAFMPRHGSSHGQVLDIFNSPEDKTIWTVKAGEGIFLVTDSDFTPEIGSILTAGVTPPGPL